MPITETIEKTDQQTILGRMHNVILFNDEVHDVFEVRNQIVKAIHCDPHTAMNITMEANNTGKAIVITAGLERCEHVAAILEEIRLGTKIEPV